MTRSTWLVGEPRAPGLAACSSRVLLALVLAAVTSCSTAMPFAPPGVNQAPALSLPGRPQSVVVVSVEGLTPDRYGAGVGVRGAPSAETLAMPSLAARARAGVWADRVVPVSPAGRYPAHATLVTGRYPDAHGVTGDALLGDRGVRRTPPWHASHVQSPSLWQLALAERRRVVLLAWPSTAGAAADGLIPALTPRSRDDKWVERLQGTATPLLLESLEREVAGAGDWPEAPERDRAIAQLACDVLSEPRPPSLVMLRFEHTSEAMMRAGVDSTEAARAFESADRWIELLVACAERGGARGNTAFWVVGDRAFGPLHTELAPNLTLERAGLISTDPRSSTGIGSWRAIARTQGAAANVYARDEASALEARAALARELERSGDFRIVSAAELAKLHGDPNAWFGLQARPGYGFANRIRPPSIAASAARAADGADPGAPESAVGFVGFGRGVRAGVRLPELRQVDIAPTIAASLGILMRGADGRPLIGALASEASR